MIWPKTQISRIPQKTQDEDGGRLSRAPPYMYAVLYKHLKIRGEPNHKATIFIFRWNIKKNSKMSLIPPSINSGHAYTGLRIS
jgi:hypothetical protein